MDRHKFHKRNAAKLRSFSENVGAIQSRYGIRSAVHSTAKDVQLAVTIFRRALAVEARHEGVEGAYPKCSRRGTTAARGG